MDDKPRQRQWIEEVYAIQSATKTVEEAINSIVHWLWQHVVPLDCYPREMPEALRENLETLRESLHTIRAEAEAAQTRYLWEPRRKALGGMPLTREEYYIVGAIASPYATAKQLGLSAHDDYDLFCLLCYEDDERYAYINPYQKPVERDPIGKLIAVGGFGTAPEDLSLEGLRPEQKEFFERWMPHVYERFKRD